MSERTKTKTKTQAKMERLISRWKRSGRTCSSFARANGISVAKFFYWKRRLESVEPRRRRRRASPSAQFMPVRLVGAAAPETPDTGEMLELIMGSGERVRLTEGVSEETLRRVIRILRERERE